MEIAELENTIKTKKERTEQLRTEMTDLGLTIVSKLEAQKTALIENSAPTVEELASLALLEQEIVALRSRKEGVNNAIDSLVAETFTLEQVKTDTQ